MILSFRKQKEINGKIHLGRFSSHTNQVHIYLDSFGGCFDTEKELLINLLYTIEHEELHRLLTMSDVKLTAHHNLIYCAIGKPNLDPKDFYMLLSILKHGTKNPKPSRK